MSRLNILSPEVTLLLEEALSCFRVESRRACELTEKALALCGEHGQIRAQLLRVRAMAHGSCGDIEAAQTDFINALNLARKYDDKELEGHCLHGLAVALHHQGLHQDALIHMYQAIEIRRLMGNQTGLQISLNSLAAFHGTLGNYQDAITALTEALALIPHNTGEMDEAQTRTNLALVYLESGQGELSLPQFEEALRLYESSPCDTAECNTLFNYSNALRAVGRQSEAVHAATRSLELARKHQSVYQEIKAQLALGSALSDPTHAEQELRLAYQRAQERQLPEPLLLAIQALGSFLVKQSRFEESKSYLLEALAKAERLGRLSLQCVLHEQLAQSHQASGNLAAALYHFQQYHQRYAKLHQDSVEQRIQSERANQEAKRIQQETETLRQQAMEDPLTQLYNRRYLNTFLETEITRSRRDELPLSVILIDIDDFKQVNDDYSHRIGDQVLLALATLLRQSSRRNDVLVRHSGDEFVLIAPETTLPDAQCFAERLRQIIAEHNWETIAPGLTLTVSLGIADLLANEDILDHADKRLYMAKRAGKNQVVA